MIPCSNENSDARRNHFVETVVCDRHEIWELMMYKLIYPQKNADLVKEVIQEFYMRCLERWEQIPPESDDGTVRFLARMLRNVYYDHHRKNKPNQRTDALDTIKDAHAESDPHEVNEMLQHCQHFIQTKLDLEDRSIMTLYLFEGKSLQEIGQALDISPKTVGTRIFRARVALRKYLGLPPKKRAA